MLTIGQAAKILNVSVKTLQRWDREGRLNARRTGTNRRYYDREQLESFLGKPRGVVLDRVAVAYCRVSSQSQRPDLKNQRATITEFCVARGLANVEYVEEIGGGLNFKRPLFLALVDRIVRGNVETLVLAHKDRLARFGIDLLRHLCEVHECKMLVINDEKLSPEREMVEDLMTIVHCFSSRIYGLRNYKKALKTALKDEAPKP